MNPSVQLKLEEGGVYKFTLSGVNVSIANSIRRTILSDIQVVCIDAENCKFDVNNTRLHNEILKERLNAIPVFTKDLEKLVKDYCVEVDVSNKTDNIIYVTTEDFKIKKKSSGEMIGKEHRDRIFPKNVISQHYIDFARLGAYVDETVETEQIKFTANFCLHSSKENGCYSVVSKCAYENTKDPERIMTAWKKREAELLKDIANVEDISQVNTDERQAVESRIQFEHRDFLFLDAQRYFKDDSFDFSIETIGVFTNQEIVLKACVFLQNSFHNFTKDLETGKYIIQKSSYMQEHSSTMENSYDVVLEDKDYTFGKVIEFILYEKFFVEKQILSFCGFKKFHPHNSYSVLRIAFHEKVELEDVYSKLIESANYAKNIYSKLYTLIK